MARIRAHGKAHHKFLLCTRSLQNIGLSVISFCAYLTDRFDMCTKFKAEVCKRARILRYALPVAVLYIAFAVWGHPGPIMQVQGGSMEALLSQIHAEVHYIHRHTCVL